MRLAQEKNCGSKLLFTAISLLPVIIFALGVTLNPSGLSFGFLLISLVVSYLSAHDRKYNRAISNYVLLTWLTMTMAVSAAAVYFSYHTLIDFSKAREFGLLSDYSRLFFWPFFIGLIYCALCLISIFYLLTSNRFFNTNNTANAKVD